MKNLKNCLSYETKESYISYLNTLSTDQLKREYYLNVNLERDIQFFYVNIKNYILNVILKGCMKALKDDSMKDYKTYLLNRITLFIDFKNNTIEPYFFELKKYDECSPINNFDEISLDDVMNLYDKITDGDSLEGCGIYNCLQSLINFIHNHTAILLHDVLGTNHDLPEGLKGFPKMIFGEMNEDGSWNYKTCLEKFINNCLSWFDVIESRYYYSKIK